MNVLRILTYWESVLLHSQLDSLISIYYRYILNFIYMWYRFKIMCKVKLDYNVLLQLWEVLNFKAKVEFRKEKEFLTWNVT